MRKLFSVYLLILNTLLCFGQNFVYPQTGPPDRYSIEDTKFADDSPSFALRIFNTASDSIHLSRLVVHLTVPYQAIQFIKNRDTDDKNKNFRADIETTLTLLDSSDSVVKEKKWRHEIFEKEFKATKSEDNFSHTQTLLDAAPGFYKFKVELNDLETRRIGKVEGRLHLDDFFKGTFALSDIIFLNSVAFLPEVEEEENTDSVYVYCEIYNVTQDDSISIDYKVSTMGKTVVLDETRSIQSKGPITKDYVAVLKDETLMTNFSANIKVTCRDSSIEKNASFRPTSESQHKLFDNLDMAIEQLIYVAHKQEIAKLKKLKGDEKLKAFNEFWKKKDFTPETQYNEYMNEYYRRINLANEQFGGHIAGWRTPRGMVLVKLGAPQYVDQPLDENYFDPVYGRKKYIIWYYTVFNRKVVFEMLGIDYRIANYQEIFDLLSGDDIKL